MSDINTRQYIFMFRFSIYCVHLHAIMSHKVYIFRKDISRGGAKWWSVLSVPILEQV